MQRIVVIGGKGMAIDIAKHAVGAAPKHPHSGEPFGFAIDDSQAHETHN